MDRVLQRALMGKAPPGWEWVETEAWRLCALFHPGLARFFLLVQRAITVALWAFKLLMFIPLFLFVWWWVASGVALAVLLALLAVRRALVAMIAAALVTHWSRLVRSAEEPSNTVDLLAHANSVVRQG
jgi:hypothetical protein